MIEKRFSCVDGAELYDFMFISPKLMLVFSHLLMFCEKENLPYPQITSIIRHKDSFSKSNTHQTGRAMDIRTRDYYTEEQIQKIVYFLEDFDNTYKVGAISRKTGLPRIVVYHIGSQWHLHIQTRH